MACFEQIKLIEILKAYKHLPSLWNESHEDFANPNVRNAGYKQLLQIYQKIDDNADMATFKQHLQTMRKHFTREFLKKQQDSHYKTSLWYFDLLSFLGTQVIRKQGQYKMNIDAAETTDAKKIKENSILPPAKFEQINITEKERIAKLANVKNWASAFSKLSAQQQIYAQTAIDEVLALAAKNHLQWNSVIHLKKPETELIKNEHELSMKQNNAIENELGDCSMTDQNACATVVPKASQVDAKPEIWYCKECKQSFRSKTGLCYHMKKEHKVPKPFDCDLCDRKYGDDTNLAVHRKRHLGIKQHLCTICGKAFTTSTELIIHNRMHTKERPFVCKICQKTFITSSSLIEHERTHSNVYAFTCNDCGKSFKKRGSWRDHCKIHTTERPFSCNICGKDFRIPETLKQHMQLHTGLKPYKCACSAEFAQLAGLCSHRFRCSIGRAANKLKENTEI